MTSAYCKQHRGVELSGKMSWQDCSHFQRVSLIASQLPRSPDWLSLISPVLVLPQNFGFYPAHFGWGFP